jgi:hypothetical protein
MSDSAPPRVLPFPFDPHPYGCPVGVRAHPAEMAELVTTLCVRVRDLLHSMIYVINPSKGQSYPVLFLSVAADAPRVALFPAWEDDKRTRRVDYARQTSLLQRIGEAGVPGESLETYAAAAAALAPGRGAGPLLIPVAAAVTEVTPLFRDLHDRLGSHLRMTVTRIPMARGRPDLPVVRCYATGEFRPRLVWFPGWASPGDKDLIDLRRMELLLQRADQRGIAESPAETVFTG